MLKFVGVIVNCCCVCFCRSFVDRCRSLKVVLLIEVEGCSRLWTKGSKNWSESLIGELGCFLGLGRLEWSWNRGLFKITPN